VCLCVCVCVLCVRVFVCVFVCCVFVCCVCVFVCCVCVCLCVCHCVWSDTAITLYTYNDLGEEVRLRCELVRPPFARYALTNWKPSTDAFRVYITITVSSCNNNSEFHASSRLHWSYSQFLTMTNLHNWDKLFFARYELRLKKRLSIKHDVL